MNAQEIAKQVIDLATVDGNFDFDLFKDTIDVLVKERVARKEAGKEAAKAAREAEQNAKGELGKAYFATLKEGDKISWTMADGTVVEGTVGKQKDGAKTAHLLKNEYEKKPDAYVPFYKINVPADFTMQATA